MKKLENKKKKTNIVKEVAKESMGFILFIVGMFLVLIFVKYPEETIMGVGCFFGAVFLIVGFIMMLNNEFKEEYGTERQVSLQYFQK